MAEEKITLSKQDRRSVALRSTFLQGSWNYLQRNQKKLLNLL